MHFFFLRKNSLLEFFVHNLDMLVAWLQCARTTDDDLKRAFLVSLRSLLKMPKAEEEAEKCNEIVRRLFSNLTTAINFPEMGSEHNSVEYLVK